MSESDQERIEREAAEWVMARDRGLTAAEQDAFSSWLAADARHGAHLARHARHWDRLNGLSEWRPEHGTRPNPDLLAPPLRRRVVRFMPLASAVAMAAVVALAWILWLKPAPVGHLTPSPNQRVLEDGTIVELNQGAVMTVQYSTTERRVTLERGEAHFDVKKKQSRPFVVRTRGVDVRALGTAFNIRVDSAAVEVLVTEGQVQLETMPAIADAAGTAGTVQPSLIEKNSTSASPPVLQARQRAVVAVSDKPAEPQIATLTAGEIERVLAWQHRLLDFTAVPVSQIVAEFNRRNVQQLVVIDPELAATRMTAIIRSDNVDGFVRLLVEGYGARTEKRGDSEILLRK